MLTAVAFFSRLTVRNVLCSYFWKSLFFMLIGICNWRIICRFGTWCQNKSKKLYTSAIKWNNFIFVPFSHIHKITLYSLLECMHPRWRVSYRDWLCLLHANARWPSASPPGMLGVCLPSGHGLAWESTFIPGSPLVSEVDLKPANPSVDDAVWQLWRILVSGYCPSEEKPSSLYNKVGCGTYDPACTHF